MKRQKIKTQYPNVRYYEHPTRKLRNGQADKYCSVRYKDDKRTVEEGLGWASDGWSAQKASKILSQIKENRKTGSGAQSLAEMREQKASQQAIEEQKKVDEDISNIILEDFFTQYYLPYAERTKRTWAIDNQRFQKEIKPVLGKFLIRSITYETIQEFLHSLVDKGRAASTVKHYKSILSHLYNLAMKTTIQGTVVFIGNNPASKIKTPPVKNARERFLTWEEANSLIAASKKLASPDLHDYIILSLNTGLRLGELQRLDWLDVDMKNEIVTVRDEANRKPGGKVPLNTNAIDIFKDRQARCKNNVMGQVFPSVAGCASHENISHSFRRLVNSLNLNDGLSCDDRRHRIVFHTLRHTFASWLALGGTDIYKIKTLMRH